MEVPKSISVTTSSSMKYGKCIFPSFFWIFSTKRRRHFASRTKSQKRRVRSAFSHKWDVGEVVGGSRVSATKAVVALLDESSTTLPFSTPAVQSISAFLSRSDGVRRGVARLELESLPTPGNKLGIGEAGGVFDGDAVESLTDDLASSFFGDFSSFPSLKSVSPDETSRPGSILARYSANSTLGSVSWAVLKVEGIFYEF